MHSEYPRELIQTAVATAMDGSMADRSSAAMFLSLLEKETPGLYVEPLLSFFRYAGTNPPNFGLEPNFHYPYIAGAIAVAKTTDVWSLLTPDEISRLDWIMRCFSVMTALGTDDENFYSTGPYYIGNYHKLWNPNYRLANIPQILFAVGYFGGADAVNRILRDFDYDTYIAKFREFGWSTPLKRWTVTVEGFCDPDGDGRGTYTVPYLTEAEEKTGIPGNHTVNFVTPKVMFMEGGEVFIRTALDRIEQAVGDSGGEGLGVPKLGEKGYTYFAHPLSDTDAIWGELARYNYGGGNVISSLGEDGPYRAYIADGSLSPVEGLPGMFLEFKSGGRSSLAYCVPDFTMGVACDAGLSALGLYNPSAPENADFAKMIWVGNTDLIYKAEKGYYSFSGSRVRGAAKLTKVMEEEDAVCYMIWESYWRRHGAERFTLEDFR